MIDMIYIMVCVFFDSCVDKGFFWFIGVGIFDIVEDFVVDFSVDLFDLKVV